MCVYAGKQWAVVMSRCTEYKDQVIELDFLYPSEGIHRRWDEGEPAVKHLLLTMCCLMCSPSSVYLTGQWHVLRELVTFSILSTLAAEGLSLATCVEAIAWICTQLLGIIVFDNLPFLGAAGYRITACAATDDQCAFVLSQPRKILPDETQETLRTSQFPSQHVKVRSGLTPCSWFYHV